MRPRERREGGEQDLFRSRLDQIIDMTHALVKLARTIDWRFLEEKLGAVYTDKPGQPPLPTRLMAGLAILKDTYDLSDEALRDRWVENPYFQYFWGGGVLLEGVWFARCIPDGCAPREGAGREEGGECAPILSGGREGGSDQAPA